jgi:hypothetical protein
VSILPVPPEGRPAEFLGGVGAFAARADAVPAAVRVGQELEFRIKVTGPAAWGIATRPDLARFRDVPLALRIEPKPDEVGDEPPVRTFVYRLRPTRAGEAVLPPVAIAAFDPVRLRYLTHATAGVSIRAVAVPGFDTRTVDDRISASDTRDPVWTARAAWGSSAALLLGGYAALALVRRRLRRRDRHGPALATRYAARLARSLKPAVLKAGLVAEPAANESALPATSCQHAALRVARELVHYLELGIGRPAGALTPEEARLGVEQVTGSHDLGAMAAQITARCDQVLYGNTRGAPSAPELLESAHGFFESLGRTNTRRVR